MSRRNGGVLNLKMVARQPAEFIDTQPEVEKHLRISAGFTDQPRH
jgi:hypothetical protein